MSLILSDRRVEGERAADDLKGSAKDENRIPQSEIAQSPIQDQDGAVPVWMRHWGLGRDPFAEPDSPYVSLPSHDEAVARLVHTIETSQRRAIFTAAAGLGKTTVLRKAFAETQSPGAGLPR